MISTSLAQIFLSSWHVAPCIYDAMCLEERNCVTNFIGNAVISPNHITHPFCRQSRLSDSDRGINKLNSHRHIQYYMNILSTSYTMNYKLAIPPLHFVRFRDGYSTHALPLPSPFHQTIAKRLPLFGDAWYTALSNFHST